MSYACMKWNLLFDSISEELSGKMAAQRASVNGDRCKGNSYGALWLRI